VTRRVPPASAALIAVALGVLSAQAPARPAPQDPLALVLLNGHVVDVRDGSIARSATIVMRAGRIESVGKDAPPPGVKPIDLGGKYVVPGLIDAHTHLASLDAARRALESGVTTVRSSGAPNFADVGLRDLAKQGAIAGPDVLASGYHVRPRLAEQAFLDNPSLAPLMDGVDTIDELRQTVRMNLARGVDWIKVLATERAGTPDTDPRKPTYTEAELRAVVDEAGAKGIPVQAHAHGDEGALAAVRAGVRSIEHGTYVSDATLTAMKERGTFLDPTYVIVTDVAAPGGDYDLPALQIRGQHMVHRLRDTIRRAHQLGVKIVTGVDTGYGPASLMRVSHEVAALVDLGLSPLQALRAATLVNAELLRKERAIGVIATGFEADLIVVEGNPLERVEMLQDPLLVVSNGRVAVNRLEFGRTSQSSPSSRR
jgi:imidazolonepropionase-like amidohydrolase